MKVYIEAQHSKKEIVPILEKIIKDSGNKIMNFETNKQAKSYDEFKRNAKNNSSRTAAAIKNADIYFHLSDYCPPEGCSTLTMAITYHEVNEKPEIYVIGKNADECQWYFHPNVNNRKVYNLEKFFKKLFTKN